MAKPPSHSSMRLPAMFRWGAISRIPPFEPVSFKISGEPRTEGIQTAPLKDERGDRL